MHRISIITPLYEVAKAERQNGNTSMSISPYYITIDSNGVAKATNTLIIALANNPSWVICCTVHTYQDYGTRKDISVYCYINSEGRVFSDLPLAKWALTELKMHGLDHLDSLAFVLLSDRTKAFSFTRIPPNPFCTIQQMWHFFKEFDQHCTTVKEAEFYYDYFVKKLELDEASLQLDEYREQLANKASIINQYEDLLKLIDSKISAI